MSVYAFNSTSDATSDLIFFFIDFAFCTTAMACGLCQFKDKHFNPQIPLFQGMVGDQLAATVWE
jgi:hypothetical protein